MDDAKHFANEGIDWYYIAVSQMCLFLIVYRNSTVKPG